MEEVHSRRSGTTTELAVRPSHGLAVREPRFSGIVAEPRWRTIRERPYSGPHDRPRSVVLLAGLAASAICIGPCLLFLFIVEVASR